MDVTAMEILGRMFELCTVLDRDHLTPLFTELGLQQGEFDVLATLRRSGAPYQLSPTALYEAMMLTSGGMTARLDRMQKRGLIERLPNPDDRRGVLVRLTDHGLALVETAVSRHAANESRLLSSLNEDEQARLNELLRKLHAGLPDAAR